MASVDEFLKTGRLGPLDVGITKEAVRGILGEPEDVSVKKNPEIWKYGALQLVFYRGSHSDDPVLSTINLFFHDPASSIPDRLGLTGWQPTSETGIEAFREYITAYDPQVYEQAPPSQDIIVSLDSGVQVTFHEGRLYGIHSRPKNEPEVKQLTIFVPKDDLDALRKEASEHRISVSALCTQWIQERASTLRKTSVRS
jgi:hypothetical protein